MRGHECYYVCAEDGHGTATMLRAEQEGITTAELIERTWQEHSRDYQSFGIELDNFGSTHSDENRVFAEEFYRKFVEKGHIERREIQQLYDPEREIFLPDRYVKGTCPKCKTPDQYGDNCENCHSTYTPRDLIDPVSSLSGATPIEKASEHHFLKLSDFEGILREWVTADRLQPEVVNKLEEWFQEGLRDWDISRDEPYFGFEIPGFPGKYFYVWVDAPIGYMASFRELCDRTDLEFDDFWGKDSEAELYHVIGKDILYFHCLFWPAMLHAADYRMPDSVWVHGFLTVDGTKMSKSRGTFITAETYAKHLDADGLRYYLAAKLSNNLADIDLNLEDFVSRVNSDLVGKVINIASRCSGFLRKRFDSTLADQLDSPELFDRLASQREAVAELLEQRDYNRATRTIMSFADEANKYIDEKEPWKLGKEEGREQELHQVLTTGINLFRILMTWLKPIVPHTAEKAEAFLAHEALTWESSATPLLGHTVNKFKPLMSRIEMKKVEAMIEESREVAQSQPGALSDAEPAAAGPLAENPIADEIEYDDFIKCDFRVAKIVKAEQVEGADKLLRVELDLGGETRQVFAGIKSAYDPETLVGRLTVMVANLKPRKMRFGMSEGMVLAAGPGGKDIFLLTPDSGAQPGQRVT